LEPDKTLPSYIKGKELSDLVRNLHGDPGLSGYGDVNLLETYAERFGLDPDYVYNNVSFDTVIMFHVKWKRERDFEERKNELERMMNESKTAK
jgi:hypothetical protein